MSGTLLGLLVGLVTLALAVFKWWVDKNGEEAKKRAEKDKEIDSANNADDVMRASGGLR